MVREVSGINGQFITTWGSDLVNDVIVPGTDRPISSTLTCRCGATISFAGFPSNAGKTSFSNFALGKEYWCSLQCAIQYEPAKMAELLFTIRKTASELSERAEILQEELLNRKSK
jgi:hypothetical protein